MDEVTSIMLNQIKEIDQRDEQQILAELAGETIDEYIYEIFDKKTKKRTVKLSWIGTREMGRAKGNIALSNPIINDNDGYIRIVVRGTDLKRNFSVFGGCHQPKQQKVKIYDESGTEIGSQLQDDPHYFTKALSKAQRNVIQAVIPANFMARMVDRFLVMTGKEPLKQLPKPKNERPRLAKDLPDLKPEDISDLSTLERTAFNRWHIQPAEVYRALGYSKRIDCNEPAWECYLKLKAVYEPEGFIQSKVEP